MVQELANKYSDKIDVKLYKSGRDFDYIRKYGMVSKSILVVNESKVIENLSRKTIEDAFNKLVENE